VRLPSEAIRKPPARASMRRVSGLALAAVRRRIFEAAAELVTTGEARDVPAVLSNRFKLSKRTVTISIVAEALKHERTAVTLRNGMVNLLAMARQAEGAIDADLSEVA
jgi:hypothetical protein